MAAEFHNDQWLEDVLAETGFSPDQIGKLFGISTLAVQSYKERKRKITAERDHHLRSLYKGKDEAIKTLAEQDAVAKELVRKRHARGWTSRSDLASAAGL